MSSDKTTIHSSDLRKIANTIGSIAQDTSAFTKLQDQSPNAGQFDAAKWLTDIYTDRRDALYQHGMDLKQTFHDMSVHLNNIADDYDAADTSNAAGLKKLDGQIDTEMKTMKTEITGDVHNPVAGPKGGQKYTSGDNKNPGGDKSDMTLNSDGTATVTGTDNKPYTEGSSQDTPNPFTVS
jgi:hypothetical protein